MLGTIFALGGGGFSLSGGPTSAIDDLLLWLTERDADGPAVEVEIPVRQVG